MASLTAIVVERLHYGEVLQEVTLGMESVSDVRPPILVVEDEPQIRRFVCAALEDQGRVSEAATAAAALEAFTGSAPALAIIEYRLLGVLLANAGRVPTHRHLLRDVWGPGHAERGHYLRIYIGHLRQKLEADPARPRHLLTETGVGYRFQFQASTP